MHSMYLVYFIAIFPLLCLSAKMQTVPRLKVKVGMMLPIGNPTLKAMIGFETSAAAVTIALDRIKNEHMLDQVDWQFVWYWPDCTEHLAMGTGVQLVTEDRVDVILGPACSIAALVAGIIGNAYNIPIISWAATSAMLSDRVRFPTFSRTVSTAKDLGRAMVKILVQFKWESFATIYSDDNARRKCYFFEEGFHETLLDNSELEVNVHEEFVVKIDVNSDNVQSKMDEFLRDVRMRSRVVVSCLDRDSDQRKFMLRVQALGMDTNDFVFLMPDYIPLAQDAFLWIDRSPVPDGLDVMAKKAFEKVLKLEWKQIDSSEMKEFKTEVVQRMKEWPFYHNSTQEDENYGSSYSPYLHDAMYLYAAALNETLAEGGEKTDGRRITYHTIRTTFEGKSGAVKLKPRGARYPSFVMKGLNKFGQFLPLLELDDQLEIRFLVPESSIWEVRDGIRPLSEPICGFENEKCNIQDSNQFEMVIQVVAVGSAVLLLIILIVFLVAVKYRLDKNEKALMAWKISYGDLIAMQSKNTTGSTNESLRSVETSSSNNSADSTRTLGDYDSYFYRGALVLVNSYDVPAFELTKVDSKTFYKMRQLNHENLNRFIGACLDGPQIMTVWNYCGKGSLQQIFQKKKITLDWFFKYSLIRDLVDALHYIHTSFLNFHGTMKSSNCMLDNRWILKLCDYGMGCFNEAFKESARDQLWTPPEHLRDGAAGNRGSVAGDVYSLAVIISEVIMRETAYASDDASFDEIVYRVRKGENPPYRPRIELCEDRQNVDVDPSIIAMMRNCWDEDPMRRPDMKTIKTQLKGMMKGNNENTLSEYSGRVLSFRVRNLTDHILSMMEKYAGSLEKEVNERTAELIEEKKKADALLSRLLPKSVAEKLKAGSRVDPESFDSVTLLFSDVVEFGPLSNRSNPLEIVGLLNDLYTLFDGIIDGYDVYKVETIGAGYMCVSGLPHRNGMNHVRECAEMAIAFQRSMRTFKVVHLPHEVVRIRIGMHTGPCVAGVVGLSMPRFCLFGDTVNTSSRMESQGKGGCIQITESTNACLKENFPEFVTQSRGEVIIKGKGVLQTYWLLGKGQAESFLADLVRGPNEAGRSSTNLPNKLVPIDCETKEKPKMEVQQ